MNHHHVNRRVARSAECSTIGRSPTEPEAIEAMVRKARDAGVIVFLRSELEALPPFDRFLVEGAHKRICRQKQKPVR